jgi:hypothetical protein
MNHGQLNQHDANQGAQSKGEFLGMTGNSGWYLLGSAGASLLIVIFCWGVLGVSLLLCLFIGVILCGLAIAYVFTLKNNRPAHYDTDFFEAALVEAGLAELVFGPRAQRPPNPFTSDLPMENIATRSAAKPTNGAPAVRAMKPQQVDVAEKASAPAAAGPKKPTKAPAEEPVIALSAYENLRDELAATQDWLEDALVERGEI